MEGRIALGVLAVGGGQWREAGNAAAAAQGSKRRREAESDATGDAKRQREQGYEVVDAATVQREPVDATKTKRSREEPEEEVVAKRQRLEPVVASKKRNWDADGSGSGSGNESGGDGMQLAEQFSTMLVEPTAAPPSPPTPIQQLVDACRAVFDGSSTPPSDGVVAYIRSMMDKIGPNDVGLRDRVRFFHKMNSAGRQNPPIITCKTVHECDNFTIAVFFLPQGAVMPLHDNPGMTVFSKLLIGSAHVTSYDWKNIHLSI